MNRRGFLGALGAVLAFPRRFFRRNTLITPEWVLHSLKAGPHQIIYVEYEGKIYDLPIPVTDKEQG